MTNNGDNSLIGTNPNGVNNSSIDEPDYRRRTAPAESQSPHERKSYFDAAAFSGNALGTPGTSKRRFFTDRARTTTTWRLQRACALTESTSLLFRVEAFNVFNHAQFNGPSAIDGNIGSSTFGNAISAAPPRILQGAVKFSF
jgi:hypothetical protein